MAQNSDYHRINGWLLVPLAYLILSLLSTTLLLALYFMAVFMPESREYLVTNSQAFTMQWYFSVLTAIIMWIFSGWLLWIFCKRSVKLPKIYILWLLVTVLLAIKAFAFSPVTDELAVRALAMPLLAAAILVPYFKRSKRVKGTFTQ
jgi:peptidoglycan/LPS O-acetylase OafA/YrhL